MNDLFQLAADERILIDILSTMRESAINIICIGGETISLGPVMKHAIQSLRMVIMDIRASNVPRHEGSRLRVGLDFLSA